jgi:hypothetical protein
MRLGKLINFVKFNALGSLELGHEKVEFGIGKE